jgi:hypothetical protein
MESQNELNDYLQKAKARQASPVVYDHMKTLTETASKDVANGRPMGMGPGKKVTDYRDRHTEMYSASQNEHFEESDKMIECFVARLEQKKRNRNNGYNYGY